MLLLTEEYRWYLTIWSSTSNRGIITIYSLGYDICNIKYLLSRAVVSPECLWGSICMVHEYIGLRSFELVYTLFHISDHCDLGLGLCLQHFNEFVLIATQILSLVYEYNLYTTELLRQWIASVNQFASRVYECLYTLYRLVRRLSFVIVVYNLKCKCVNSINTNSLDLWTIALPSTTLKVSTSSPWEHEYLYRVWLCAAF